MANGMSDKEQRGYFNEYLRILRSHKPITTYDLEEIFRCSKELAALDRKRKLKAFVKKAKE